MTNNSSGSVSPIPVGLATRSPSMHPSVGSSVWSAPGGPTNAFPPGYTEAVFRMFDFRHKDEIRVDDLGCVLSALGFDPDATLSTAYTLMTSDSSQAGSFAAGGLRGATSPGSLTGDGSGDFFPVSTHPSSLPDGFHGHSMYSDVNDANYALPPSMEQHGEGGGEEALSTGGGEWITMPRFLEGLDALQILKSASANGKDDLIANGFRLFDLQRRGIVSVEDFLATACLETTGRGIPAGEVKDIVSGLKSSSHIKGLTHRDFRSYLSTGLSLVY